MAGSILSDEERGAKLRRQIAYCLESPFYRSCFEAAGVDPATIRTVDDLASLPVFVTPDIHRRSQEQSLEARGHPFSEFLCADPEEIVALSSTSGTTGSPTFYPFTRRDVDITDLLWQRALGFIGVRPGDRVLLGFGLSMYLAGLPLVRALEGMGALPIAIGAEAGAERLLRLLTLTRPRVLACTPSYAEHLMERVPEVLGMEAPDLGIELIVCAGEPGAGLPEVRSRLESGWGARVFDLLGGTHGIMMASAPTDEYHGMYVLGDELLGLDATGRSGHSGARRRSRRRGRRAGQDVPRVGRCSSSEVLGRRCVRGIHRARPRKDPSGGSESKCSGVSTTF